MYSERAGHSAIVSHVIHLHDLVPRFDRQAAEDLTGSTVQDERTYASSPCSCVLHVIHYCGG